MAKRVKRHYRRHYGDLVDVGLGMFSGSVPPGHAILGGLLGTAGAAGAKFAGAKFIPEFSGRPYLLKAMPLIGSALVGVIAMFAQKKSPRGQAHLAGALSAGLGITAFSFLQDAVPELADLVEVKNLADVYVRNPAALSDVYVRNPAVAHYADAPQLAGVMAAAMEGEDNDMAEIGMLAQMNAMHG